MQSKEPGHLGCAWALAICPVDVLRHIVLGYILSHLVKRTRKPAESEQPD